MAVIFLLPSESYSLTVKGLPEWLKATAMRGLTAVWEEMPNDPAIDREGTLAAVSARLFSGYNIRVKPNGQSPEVEFTPDEELTLPDVKVNVPDLRGNALALFSADTAGMGGEISVTASEIPQGALVWAEDALREQVSKIISRRLPGWEFSQQIYILPSSTIIAYTFRPSPDMILALKPEINSRTIPVMFRSDLEARIVPEMSSLIGLPVKWAEKHRNDIEEEALKFLEERNAVGNLKAQVTVKFKPGRISEIEATADSREVMFSVWVSAYAGIEGRYPEAGIFFGFRPMWRVNGHYNFAPEIYTELIFSLNDFGMTHRIGGRFELLSRLWAGIEYEMPDGVSYVRFEYVPVKIRRPYGRWRMGINSSLYDLGLGYRFDEHISAEIYYDGKIGIRGMWNL